MKAININCKHQDFIEQILSHLKTVETRNTNSLKSLVGKRIGLIKTGCGKAMLMGYADIVEVIEYDTESFRRDYSKHLVPVGSEYDIKNGKKYGYVLDNVVRCEPTEVMAKGIVIRNI